VLERRFARLWREYYRRLWAFARSFAAMGSEETEDAVQEIMWRIYRALPSYDASRPSAPWVFRIARNYCIDEMRARRAPFGAGETRVEPDELADASPGPAEALARSAARVEVQRFMESLEAADRQILFLTYHERLRLRDVAAALDMPEGTVKWRIHELKKLLKRGMEAAR
jgi:RNA polymerase sigma-70 factor (ECF subfamily)